MGLRAGFRFWWQDAVTIFVCAVGTGLGWRFLGPLALLLPLTLGHFFLFCNVFRIRRSYEIYWTLIFLLNVGFWLYRDELNCLAILVVQTPVTVAVILLEVKSTRYHGVLWQRLNPGYEPREN